MNEQSPALIGRSTLEAIGAFVVLLGLTWWTFGGVLDLRPLGGDNLYVLSWANRTGAAGLLRVDPVIYPEWRPLAYSTIWLQFRWTELDHIAFYHAVNLAIWASCAWLVWAVVKRVTASRAASAVAAVLVLTDVRAITAQTLIVERQTSLAVLFGLAAVWVLFRDPKPRVDLKTSLIIAALCLASAFSKEYGIAFAAALAVVGLFEHRRDLLMAGASTCAVYAIARWSFAGGANSLYCEYMGYFFTVRKVCYSGVDGTALSQMTYNVTATGIGTLLPGLLTADGQIALAPMRLAVSAGWLVIAWFGWRRGSWLGRLAALVILGNTALNFMVYGGRNQLIAVAALGLVVGLGVGACEEWIKAQPRRGLQLALSAMIVAVLAGQTWLTRREAGQQIADLLSQDPCVEILHPDQHDPALIHAIKLKYGMRDADCAAGRQ